MNYLRFLNPVSAARKPSPIRMLTSLLAKSPPSMISLAGGMPNPEQFPFQSAEFKLRDGTSLTIDESKMKVGLQYGPTPGYPPLVQFIKDMQLHLHKPPNFDWKPEDGGLDVCVTPGCQDGICKTLEMLVQPGDNVIMDCPTYPGTLAAARPLGCNILPVDTDQNGLKPDHLRQVLSQWKPEEAHNPNSDVPRLMYTIPNGCNPTGSSLTEDRKKEIYQIASEYDMLILEDDPYYFLQFTEHCSPTFLSMDVDGRVIRFDSFSKIISSGLRVGFVTGPQPLINRLQLHVQVSSAHTASMSQLLIHEVVNRWKLDGFLEHVKNVCDFYKKQRDSCIESANRWLSGLAEWHEPQAGMFLWLKLNGINDTQKMISEKAMKKEVVLVPGCAFMPDDEAPSPYVRAAFSIASPQQIDKGFERLAELIKEEQKEQKA